MASKLPRPITCQPSVVHREMYLPCRPVESIEMRKQRLQTVMGQHTFPSDYKCRFQATRTKSVKRFSTFNVSLWSKLFSSNILTLVASCSK